MAQPGNNPNKPVRAAGRRVHQGWDGGGVTENRCCQLLCGGSGQKACRMACIPEPKNLMVVWP